MIDDRSKKTILTLLPEVQRYFTAFLEEAQPIAEQEGLQYLAIQGCRTWDEQTRLYAQGRTAPGKKVTNSKPGSSYHNYGLAIDCGVFHGSVYLDVSEVKKANLFHTKMSKIAKLHNLRWGGDFHSIVDMPHFEYNTPLTIAQLRDMHEKGVPIHV